MTEFISPEFQPIKFINNPVLYLLAVADTIEPIKIFSDLGLNQMVVWGRIDFQIRKESISLKAIDERMPFDRLAQKVIGFWNWLDVDVDIHSIKKQ